MSAEQAAGDIVKDLSALREAFKDLRNESSETNWYGLILLSVLYLIAI